MAVDIGLNPPGLRHDRVVAGYATSTGIKFGYAVIKDTAATGNRRAVTTTTTPGAGPVAGVVVSQTDPTDGSAVGDQLEVCDSGIVEVNLAASNAITKGDLLIMSATAGAVKKIGAETDPVIVGVAAQDMASQAGVVRIAMEMGTGFYVHKS